MLATLSACSGDCSPLRRSISSSRCVCPCLLCVSGPIILRRSLYRATANYDMGYPLYCENELPVTLLTLKLVLLGGWALQIFYWWPLLLPPKSKTISTSSSCIKLHELTCPILTCTHTCSEISKPCWYYNHAAHKIPWQWVTDSRYRSICRYAGAKYDNTGWYNQVIMR